MRPIWLALLLLTISLLLLDGAFSAASWWAQRDCSERQLAFDFQRQACSGDPTLTLLQWWQAHVVAMRSVRAVAFAGFFTFSVLLLRRHRVPT